MSAVPTCLSTLHHDCDKARGQAEGAKNLCVRTGHQWKLMAGTYNVKYLLSDDRKMKLGTELKIIHWDIIASVE